VFKPPNPTAVLAVPLARIVEEKPLAKEPDQDHPVDTTTLLSVVHPVHAEPLAR
jgi:hypothetical protein